MAEEITPKQKLAIAKYFILCAPIGEVHEVVKDVKGLVNDSTVLNDETMQSLLREYNLNNLTFAAAPNGDDVLVSKFGEVDHHSYLEPSKGKVLKFDHVAQTFTSETDQKQVLQPEIEQQRKAIEATAKAYIESNYKHKKFAAGVYGDDEGNITVCISAKNTRLSSYWTGGINAIYKVRVNKAGTTDLHAQIRVVVHYFEDGNVQLHTDFSKTVHVDIGQDPQVNGRAVTAAIEKLETDYFTSLEEMYVNMHNVTFKAMRRFLPVSGQPMKWDSAVHGLAAEITQ